MLVAKPNPFSEVDPSFNKASSYPQTSPEFLAVVNPRLAVISVGADNKFGHPSDEVLERLKKRIDLENIYRTSDNGTIEFITDGERLWVKVGG